MKNLTKISIIVTLIFLGVLGIYLFKQKVETPFVKVLSINLLGNSSFSYENIEPLLNDTSAAIDEDFGSFIEPVSNIQGKVGRLSWALGRPYFIKKLIYKVGVWNEKENESIPIYFDVWDIGNVEIIYSNSIKEQIIQNEVIVNATAGKEHNNGGLHIWLSPLEPHDKAWIKIYEIQLLG